jgi:putative thioredoxin
MADSPHGSDARHDQFQELVIEQSQRLPVLVDFWAAWCAPCQMLAPILSKLVEDYRGKLRLVKVNTDEEQELARQYGIRSLPTVMLFKDGKPVDQFMGVQPERVIRQFIERHVPREAENLRSAAREALERGERSKARQSLQRALELEPENPGVAADVARLLLEDGRYDDAEELLSRLSREARDDPQVKSALALVSFARTAQEAPPVAELEARLERAPGDAQLRHQLSARRLMAGDHEGALALLLETLQLSSPGAREQAREAMLAAFAAIGDKHDLVSRYRVKLFNALH